MRRRAVVYAMLMVAFTATSAWAGGTLQTLPAGCITERTASIQVQLSAQTTQDASVLKRQFDADIRAIQSLAAEAGMARTMASGFNYSIMPLPDGTTPNDGPCMDCERDERLPRGGAAYQLSGSANFQVEPASRATELLERLRQKQYSATLSFVDVNKVPGICTLNVVSGKWR